MSDADRAAEGLWLEWRHRTPAAPTWDDLHLDLATNATRLPGLAAEAARLRRAALDAVLAALRPLLPRLAEDVRVRWGDREDDEVWHQPGLVLRDTRRDAYPDRCRGDVVGEAVVLGADGVLYAGRYDGHWEDHPGNDYTTLELASVTDATYPGYVDDLITTGACRVAKACDDDAAAVARMTAVLTALGVAP